MLPGLTAENSTLRTVIGRLRDSAQTPSQERRNVVMVTQDVRDLAAHSKKIRASAEVMRKQNIELAGEAPGKVAQATVESARSRALAEELASVTS